jgi:hypothetical protein
MHLHPFAGDISRDHDRMMVKDMPTRRVLVAMIQTRHFVMGYYTPQWRPISLLLSLSLFLFPSFPLAALPFEGAHYSA